MNKLYFVKFYPRPDCLDGNGQGRGTAWNFIHPLYRKQHKLAECTLICNTPDEVINFEPV